MLKQFADVLEMGKHVEMVDMQFLDLGNVASLPRCQPGSCRSSCSRRGWASMALPIRAFQEIHGQT